MTHPPASLHDELRTAISLARSAGAEIERVRRQGLERRTKSDDSPVTAADLASDRLIGEGLRRAFPADAVLSEELGWRGEEAPERLWIVDPVDGTRSLLDGREGYAVQIGLVAGGVALLGVVYDPRCDRLFHAVRGGPAWVVEASRPARAVQLMAPSDRGASRLVTSFRVPADERRRLVERLGIRDAGRLHSLGIKVGTLLLDRADVYVSQHPVSSWDVCAPWVILRAAGGHLSLLDGRPPRLPRHRGDPTEVGPFVASAEAFHDELVGATREVLGG